MQSPEGIRDLNLMGPDSREREAWCDDQLVIVFGSFAAMGPIVSVKKSASEWRFAILASMRGI